MKELNTFRLLCSSLSHEENRDSLVNQFRTGNVIWESLVEVSSRHLLCPAIYSAFDRKDLWACVPPELRQYLATLYQLNRERNELMVAGTVETIHLINEAGIEPVLLKGIANVLSGLYPDPSVRFLGDVDLLVPKERLAQAVDKLKAAGYHPLNDPTEPVWRDHFHFPRLVKENDFLGIELHTELLPGRYRKILDAPTVVRDAQVLPIQGFQALVPSADHRIIHNVAHSQLLDNYFRMGQISLRQLYDLVLIRGAFSDRIDWPGVESRFSRAVYKSALGGYLLAARDFFDQPVPESVRINNGARFYLRWLSAQKQHAWVMRLSPVFRIPAHALERLRSLADYPHIPPVWTREWLGRNGRILAGMMRKGR